MIIDSPIISGSYAASGSLNQFGNVVISGSLTVTGSIIGTASFAATASYLSGYVSPFPYTGSAIISGSLEVTGSANIPNITGSLLGTSSFANTATSASYALTASFSLNVPVTSSYANNATSASFATTASYLTGYISPFPFTGSAIVSGSLEITGSAAISNLQGTGVRYLVADASGSITAQSASAALKATQEFTSTAGQTTFSVTNGYATGYVDVFINGSKLSTTEFTDTSGTNIVLATGSFSGDTVEVVKYTPAAGVTNNVLRQLTTFTGSAGQTVFSASYTPGLLDIFYNGSRLSTSDYTANNGTYFTLATGSADNDILDVLVYSYQVGAFNGIGGVGVASQVAYFDTTNSITGSPNFTISGSTMLITGSLTISGSSTFTNIGPAVFSGSLTSTAGFTGSFSGTATSASFAATASSADNFLTRGTLTAQTLVVQTITSSVDFVTGSTRFGSISENTHQFTGSVSVSGSLTGASASFSSALAANNLTGEGQAGAGGVLNLRQDAIYLPKGNGYSSIASSFSVFEFYGYTGASTYKNFTFRFNGLTDNTRRDYTLPDADGTLALLSGSQTFNGATTFASTLTTGDIITNNTGGYRTLASQGYTLRNDANNSNLGGLSRRSYWAGGAALDTQIFAETGYGIFLNVNGSSTSGLAISSSGVSSFTRPGMTSQLNYEYQNIRVTSGFSGGYTDTRIQSLLAGYDGLSIHGTDIGYGYDTAGYALMFSTNNDTTGNPIERMRITSTGAVQVTAIGQPLYILRNSSSQGQVLFSTNHDSAGYVHTMYITAAGEPSAVATGYSLGKNSGTNRSINAGGTINASGADYAEYMIKADVNAVISKGDIVGVNLNGLLTVNFTDAISFVVKSTDPSYIGGDTWFNEVRPVEDASQEEKDEFEARYQIARAKVDRIAFSGQVPCNVTGANVGDYIIPIELENGKIGGQAVTNPTFEQYQISVGKVWKIMEDGRAWIAVKIG